MFLFAAHGDVSEGITRRMPVALCFAQALGLSTVCWASILLLTVEVALVIQEIESLQAVKSLQLDAKSAVVQK